MQELFKEKYKGTKEQVDNFSLDLKKFRTQGSALKTNLEKIQEKHENSQDDSFKNEGLNNNEKENSMNQSNSHKSRHSASFEKSNTLAKVAYMNSATPLTRIFGSFVGNSPAKSDKFEANLLSPSGKTTGPPA